MNRTRTLVTAGVIAAALALPLSPANAGSGDSRQSELRRRTVRRHQRSSPSTSAKPGKPVAGGEGRRPER